jgi:hypothetical protein
MRSPTEALLWEIWLRHRATIAAIVVLTVAGRWLHASEQAAGSGQHSSLVSLLGMISFLLLFGVFNYTEYSGSRAVGRFPSRLFTLPVSSLRLVTIPTISGIVSIELLYLAWSDPLSAGGPTSAPFVGVLLASFMVFFQTALWTCERIGVLRLLLVGVIGIAMFGVGLLPSFPPSPPAPWRSESGLATVSGALAIGMFVAAWQHVVALRAGGRDRALDRLFARIADVWPARRRAFASTEAAQFWFEWRCSGTVLPALVTGALLAVVAPMSWAVRGNGTDTMQLLLATLATPIVLAVPVGLAFSKPTLWSENLSLPAFVAVRPLSAEDIVAVKVKVAMVSVAITWLAVVAFLIVWLTAWANLDGVRDVAIQLWVFHGHSVLAVCGIAALIVLSGMYLTWRSLVCRLWSGLSGSRPLFSTSVGVVLLAAIGWMISDPGRLPGWVLEDPQRLAPFVWVAAVAVIAKYSLAAYAWRRVSSHYLRQYLLVWVPGTICVLALALVFWGVVRSEVPLGLYRLQRFMILVALLAIPIARVGLAPSRLARNRHRRA